MQKLTREFFFQPTDELAKQLLGKMLVMKQGRKTFKAIITETEIYHANDPASHASRK